MDGRMSSFLPIFLGRQRFAGVSCHMTFAIPNNADGRVLTMQVQGYIWTPQAANVNGGLQRPSAPLYGN